MSRPWNSSVCLQVSARAVRGTLCAGWPRRKVIQQAIQVVPAPEGAEADAGSFDAGSVDVVLAQLAAAAPIRGARLAVELADDRVHFDVVGGEFGTASNRQLRAVSTACVTELMGDEAAAQSIRWQLQHDLAHLLICAIAQTDIDSLTQAAARHGLRLASLQPDFSAAWNRHARSLPAGNGVFGVSGGGHATVVCVERGAVVAITSGAWAEEPPDTDAAPVTQSSLDQRVDRLLASAGIDATDITAFLFVAPELATRRLSPRWAIVGRTQEAA